MDLTPRCIEVDLSRCEPVGLSNSAEFVKQIACVRTASAGTPLGDLFFALGAQGCMTVPKDLAFPLRDLVDWQTFRHVLLGATAASFLLVSGDRNVDARAYLHQQWAPEQTNQRSNVNLRIQRLLTVKSAFGSSNSDLARMLRVSRTQLYKWLSDDQEVQLEAENWSRLADLDMLAREWNKLSARPLRVFLTEEVESGATLLSLLSTQHLDVRTIRAAMARYAALPPAMDSRDSKLRVEGVRPRPRAGKSYWDE